MNKIVSDYYFRFYRRHSVANLPSRHSSIYMYFVTLCIVKQSHYISGQAFTTQEVESPRFQDNRHMKVVMLTALRTSGLYPPGNIPGTNFCQSSESTPAPQSGRKDYVNEKSQ
jgi:hypothetical protein